MSADVAGGSVAGKDDLPTTRSEPRETLEGFTSVVMSLAAPGPPPRKEVGDLPVNLLKTHPLTMTTSDAEAEG